VRATPVLLQHYRDAQGVLVNILDDFGLDYYRQSGL
jgi:hypothetical protein